MGVLSHRMGGGTSGVLPVGTGRSYDRYSSGSASAFMPTGNFDENLTANNRPFRDIGKQNVQLVAPPTPKTPLGMEPPKPFSGVPVLGSLFEGLNAVGSLPIGGVLKTLPGIGSIANAVEMQNVQTWQANVAKAGE